tara:strand:- start:3881 stop:4171 length:291 start_codon:yes stop_codon:yes gene_type:complete
MISDGENVMNSSINIQKKIPFRTCIASFGLTLLGFTFFGLSIYFYINHDKHEGFAPLLIISIIALVPGIYSLYILFGTFCKWKGYSIDSLPSYEIL